MLGALSVLLVDRQCRKPFIRAEPGCGVLLQMCKELEGYRDQVWAASRRAAASRCVTSLMQRDHEARLALVDSGGIAEVLQLLDAKVGEWGYLKSSSLCTLRFACDSHC